MPNINILLFTDFETLDAFGPVEVLSRIPEARLHYVSMAGGPIVSRQGTPVLTEPLGSVDSAGILLVPGGQGTRTLVKDADFIGRLQEVATLSQHCLTVCTGSALLACTGLLDHRKATSNKKALDWVRSVNDKVLWQGRARWVVDQKYYTSSGVSAGIDMALGFIADRWGSELAEEIACSIEYRWNADPYDDPFARACEK